jgi:uncharacterized coiled-coil DUF342 family protein
MTKEELAKLRDKIVEITTNYDQQKVIVAKGIRQAVTALCAEEPDSHRWSFHELREKRKEVRARRREAIPFLLDMADILEGKDDGKDSLPE